MTTYKIFEQTANLFLVYECWAYGEKLVKTFKTRKSAEKWVAKKS